jgi:hypothetical protein
MTNKDRSRFLRNDKQKGLRNGKQRTGNGRRGDFVGERGGGLRRARVHRGPSRSKDALRMTNKDRSRFPSGMTNKGDGAIWHA